MKIMGCVTYRVLLFSVLLICAVSSKKIELEKYGDIATLEFPPNQAVSITNPLLWKVKVSCKVETPDDIDVMIAKVLKGSATLNGQDLKDGTQAEVRNGDSLIITATALGKFEITNLGQNKVVTSCGLALETLQEIEYIKDILHKNEEDFLNFLEY